MSELLQMLSTVGQLSGPPSIDNGAQYCSARLIWTKYQHHSLYHLVILAHIVQMVSDFLNSRLICALAEVILFWIYNVYGRMHSSDYWITNILVIPGPWYILITQEHSYTLTINFDKLRLFGRNFSKVINWKLSKRKSKCKYNDSHISKINVNSVFNVSVISFKIKTWQINYTNTTELSYDWG